MQPPAVNDRLCLLSSALPGVTAQVVAEKARDAGFPAIEWGVGPDQVTNGTKREARGLLELAAFHGLELVAVMVQTGPASLDKPAGIKPIAAFAAELGAPYLRLWTPGFGGGRFADELKKRRAAVAQAVEITSAHGIVLLLEHHPDSLAPSTTLTRELIEAHSPDEVGVLWDPGNGIIEGHLDPRRDRRPRRVPAPRARQEHRLAPERWGLELDLASLATGMLDWAALLAALDASGYRGRLSIDHLPGAATPATLRRETAALRALLEPAR